MSILPFHDPRRQSLLQHLYDQFILNKTSLGRAPGTLTFYGIYTGSFLQWLTTLRSTRPSS